jgi:hypothetical protein
MEPKVRTDRILHNNKQVIRVHDNKYGTSVLKLKIEHKNVRRQTLNCECVLET